jgi:hypothetical protein
MIIIECVGVNMDFQIPLLIIDMSAYFQTHRVTHLTCISARVVWDLWKIFQKVAELFRWKILLFINYIN